VQGSVGSEELRSGTGTEVLVELTRGAVVESIHRGAFAVARADGHMIASCGNPSLGTWVRSAAKPFQALGLFESGAIDRFHIPEDELAIVIASHSGEDFHIRLVMSLMTRTGVREEWLLCGPQAPFDPITRAEMIRTGAKPGVLQNNCSGKHAGMCASALSMGVPVEGYVDPAHPVQEANRRRLALLGRMGGPGEVGVAVDGCSVPTFGVPLDRFATAFARLAEAGAASGAEAVPGMKAVWDAMVRRPEVIAGTRERIDTALMLGAREAGLPLVAKAGAEGVYAIGVVSERHGPIGIALKIEDGGERARNVAAIEILERLELARDPVLDLVAEYRARRLTNRAGRIVGEIRPCFDMRIRLRKGQV